MKVIITEQFYREIKKIDDRKIHKKLKNIIDKLLDSIVISDIPDTRKLKGSKRKYYRTRIGDYRLCFEIDNNTIYVMKFCHRKDIYRKFP